MRRLIMAALVAVLLPGVAAALPPLSAAEIDRLVKQLGSNGYYEREAATKALRAVGKPALPALRLACECKDAEVRKRAQRIIEAIAPVKQASWPSETAILLEVDVKAGFFFVPVQTDIIILTPPQPAKK
jgi:hypothetical protein